MRDQKTSPNNKSLIDPINNFFANYNQNSFRQINTFIHQIVSHTIYTLITHQFFFSSHSSAYGQLQAGAPPAKGTCGQYRGPACTRSRYRTYDGSCNNLQIPSWGMANTKYARLLAPNYADSKYISTKKKFFSFLISRVCVCVCVCISVALDLHMIYQSLRNDTNSHVRGIVNWRLIKIGKNCSCIIASHLTKS